MADTSRPDHLPNLRTGGTPPALGCAMPSMDAFLREMIERKASDLHLTTDSPPVIRLHGELVPLAHPPLSGNDSRSEPQPGRFRPSNAFWFACRPGSVPQFC